MLIPAEKRIETIKQAIDNGMQLGVLDTETSHEIVATFTGTGEAHINHKQIKKPAQVISIQYLFNYDKHAKYLQWDNVGKGEYGYDHDDSSMLEEFAVNVLPQMDIVVTQNGDSFDFKVLNNRLMLQQLSVLTQVPSIDILKLSRASFRADSHKLDRRSELHGLGGKIQMVEQDWFDVEENIVPVSTKMGPYGCKDVEDTRDLMFKELPYYKALPLNVEKVILSFAESRTPCLKCESNKHAKFNTVKKGRGKNTFFECLSCGNKFNN